MLLCGMVRGQIKVFLFNIFTVQVWYHYIAGTVSEIQYL